MQRDRQQPQSGSLPHVQVSRQEILEAKLRASPVAAGVDIATLAALTDGMSGAELSEVCRRACQLALRCANPVT